MLGQSRSIRTIHVRFHRLPSAARRSVRRVHVWMSNKCKQTKLSSTYFLYYLYNDWNMRWLLIWVDCADALSSAVCRRGEKICSKNILTFLLLFSQEKGPPFQEQRGSLGKLRCCSKQKNWNRVSPEENVQVRQDVHHWFQGALLCCPSFYFSVLLFHVPLHFGRIWSSTVQTTATGSATFAERLLLCNGCLRKIFGSKRATVQLGSPTTTTVECFDDVYQSQQPNSLPLSCYF